MQVLGPLFVELRQLRIAEITLVALWCSVGINFLLAVFAVAGPQVRRLIWKPKLVLEFRCTPECLRYTFLTKTVPETTNSRHPITQPYRMKCLYSLLVVRNKGSVAATNVTAFIEYAEVFQSREQVLAAIDDGLPSTTTRRSANSVRSKGQWIGHKLNWSFGAGEDGHPGDLRRIASKELAYLDFIRADSGVKADSSQQKWAATHRLCTVFKSNEDIERLDCGFALVVVRVSCDEVGPRRFCVLAYLPKSVFASFVFAESFTGELMPDAIVQGIGRSILIPFDEISRRVNGSRSSAAGQ